MPVRFGDALAAHALTTSMGAAATQLNFKAPTMASAAAQQQRRHL
jgi:hypothetical protein